MKQQIPMIGIRVFAKHVTQYRTCFDEVDGSYIIIASLSFTAEECMPVARASRIAQ